MSASTHLVCPHCNAVNRLPSARLAEHPACGKCHRALFTGHPLELNSTSFDRHLRSSGIPLLVDFWAPWCGPCKVMAPAFEQAAARLEPGVRLAKINTEIEQSIAASMGIRSIPTLVMFRNGREIARQSGALGTEDIVRWAKAGA